MPKHGKSPHGGSGGGNPGAGGGSEESSQSSPEEVTEHRNGAASARPFGDGLKELKRRSSDVRHRFDDWAEVLRREARQNPGRSVALALGAGYVLGGGLFSALTARLVATAVRIGLRVAVVPLVSDGIAALGEGLIGRGGGGERDDDERMSPPREEAAAAAERQ